MDQSISEKKICLNCEKPIDDKDSYCGQCGQKTTPAKVPIIHFIQDFLGDYFSYDSKIFKSIIPLFVNPGHLTLEYIKGKRVKFIPPFRVFIIISVAFFLLFSSLNNQKSSFIEFETTTNSGLNDSLPNKNENYAHTENKKVVHSNEPGNKAVVKLDFGNDFNIGFNIDSTRNLISKVGFDTYIDSIRPNDSKYEKFIVKQLIKIFIDDHSKFTEVVVNFSSKLIFLMLPFFALLLKFIYIRKGKYFYEHFIFSLHFHTFIFSYLIINLLFVHYVFDFSFSISILLLLVYLFMAMKKVYGESYKKTISSFIMLSLSYLLLFIPLFFLLLLFTSLVFY
ncbi:MAG: DUF3667 domain-containing protein [Bacteroidetes bacterium]|nr:DUF3667 domain-containing protein [Bacteroidota bacterium]HET6244482.1 DUF3667 domain-containing protein [Bacteroidia bacterium]